MSVGNLASRKQLRITDFLFPSHPLLPPLFSEHQERHKNVYFFNQGPYKALLVLVYIGMPLHLQIKNTDVELPVWIYRCVRVQVWKAVYHRVHYCATRPQAMSIRAWIQNQNFSGKDLKELLFCSRRRGKKRENNTNQTTEGKQTWNEHWKLRKK